MEPTPTPIIVQNRIYARLNASVIYDIKDFINVEISEVTLSAGESLKADKTFAFANSGNQLFVISVAKTKGKYYYGYSLHIEDSFSGCGPSFNFAHEHGYDTLVKCLTAALQECENLQFDYRSSPDNRLKVAAQAALDTIKRGRLVQLSIFDML